MKTSVAHKTGELLVTEVIETGYERFEVDATLYEGEWYLDHVTALSDGEPNPSLSKAEARRIRDELTKRLLAGDYDG